jgi:hypothetical protein
MYYNFDRLFIMMTHKYAYVLLHTVDLIQKKKLKNWEGFYRNISTDERTES